MEMRVAKAHLQLVENASINGKAAFFHRSSKPAAFLERHRPIKGIGVIDRLEIDKRLRAAVRPARHRPHGGDLAHFAERPEISPLFRVRLPVHEGRLDIAAKQHCALTGERVLDRVRQAVDCANGARAKRDADQENREARKAAAQIAERKAKRERQPETAARAALSSYSMAAVMRRLSHGSSARCGRPSWRRRARSAGEFGIVCDKNESRSGPAMQRENKLHDLRAGFAVEISGRFVGKQDFGLGRERACKRDALLLAA